MSPEVDTALEALSAALWRTRALLELTVWRTMCLTGTAQSGAVRWAPVATRELLAAVDHLGRHELHRAAVTAEAARALGWTGDGAAGDGPSLAELVAVVPEPWRDVFEDHLRVLRDLQGELASLAGAAREAVAEALEVTRRAVADSLGEPDTYRPDGTRDHRPVGGSLDVRG